MICKLVGYHGTTKENAESIYNNQKFNISVGNELFLGNGIYLYDSCINALYYNIGKYIKMYNKLPKFIELNNSYSILKLDVECEDNQILDLNTYESKYSYIYAMKKIDEIFKDNEEYNDLKFKDGYILNFLIKYRDRHNMLKGCKIIKNIYNKDIVNKNEIKTKKYIQSRIAYERKQTYYCIINDNRIKRINYINNNKKNYDDIEKLYDIIRRD